MKRKLKNYIGCAVSDELYDQLWCLSVNHNESLANTLRLILSAGAKRLFAAIPPEKLPEIREQVNSIREKINTKEN